MIALLAAVATLVREVPELIPLLRTLVDTLRGAGTKEEKLTKARRALFAAGARTALLEALPGK